MRWALCSMEDVPPDDAWLGPRERAVLAALDGEQRRAEWRLGRWTAKRLLGGDAEILPAEDGAPTSRLPVSIAHRRGRALAVVGDEGEAVGCDLEPLRAGRDVLDHVAWEAAAKALRRGLLSGERPEVERDGSSFVVVWPDGARVTGTWWVDGGWAMAVGGSG